MCETVLFHLDERTELQQLRQGWSITVVSCYPWCRWRWLNSGCQKH